MTISHPQAQELMDSLREVLWQWGAARRRMPEPMPGVPHHALSFLVVIYREDGMRQSDLAEALQIDASVASRHVAMLLEHNLISREVDPRDRRANVLRVTKDGLAALASLRERQTDWLLEVLAAWDDERASSTASAFREIAHHITDSARRAHRTAQDPETIA